MFDYTKDIQTTSLRRWTVYVLSGFLQFFGKISATTVQSYEVKSFETVFKYGGSLRKKQLCPVLTTPENVYYCALSNICTDTLK